MNFAICPKMRWISAVNSSVFAPEIAMNDGREGVKSQMKISMIEALVPAVSTNKSN